MPSVNAVWFVVDLALFATFLIAACFCVFRTRVVARFLAQRAPRGRRYDSLARRLSRWPPWHWLWNGDDWETFRTGIAHEPERYPRVLLWYRLCGFALALPALMLVGVVSVLVAMALLRG